MTKPFPDSRSLDPVTQSDPFRVTEMESRRRDVRLGIRRGKLWPSSAKGHCGSLVKASVLASVSAHLRLEARARFVALYKVPQGLWLPGQQLWAAARALGPPSTLARVMPLVLASQVPLGFEFITVRAPILFEITVCDCCDQILSRAVYNAPSSWLQWSDYIW